MSRFANKINGGSGTYNAQEQAYSGVAYTARHDAKSYVNVAKTEQVMMHRHYPAAVTDGEYAISPRKDRVPEKNYDHNFSPKARGEPVSWGPTKNSQWNNGISRDNSPPSKDNYGKDGDFKYENHDYSDDSEDDDGYVCNDDSVCVKNTKGSRPSNGYTLPTNYTVPIISNQPKKETYYSELYSNGYNESKDKGNDYGSRSSATPFQTQPKNITRYETVGANNKPVTSSPPQYNSWPRIGQKPQEMIDSTEARRRYGRPSPPSEAAKYGVEKYTSGTIDSKEAARRYNGVFLPN